jgi:hypothetical protein
VNKRCVNMRMCEKIMLLAVVFTLMAIAVSAIPTGPDSLTITANSRLMDLPNKHTEALAGNVTGLDFYVRTVTKYWQGYYGNVSGEIVLADSGNNTLYRWINAEPKGEIYAARNATVNWSNIHCASQVQRDAEDNTFLRLNQSSDLDSINNTFTSTSYPSFFTGFLNFTSGSCRTTSVNDTGTSTIFYEVLQMDDFNSVDNGNATMIYTSIISQNSQGFDSLNHDFQMMVAEPGSGNETYPNGITTTYYFWVELG